MHFENGPVVIHSAKTIYLSVNRYFSVHGILFRIDKSLFS
jgi:hypothetical protein